MEIINSKLSIRDTEFSDRQEDLRRAADRLRRVRARVRNIIASDETLRCTMKNINLDNSDSDLHLCYSQKEGDTFYSQILPLLSNVMQLL